MNNEERLYELLTSQYSDTDSLIELWNNCYMVTKVYKMERFEEIIGDSFKKIFPSLANAEWFSLDDDYFYVDTFDQLHSCNDELVNDIIDFEYLTKFIINGSYNRELLPKEIKEVLDNIIKKKSC